MDALIRRLTPEDAEAYVVLRHAMLEEHPAAFLSSPEDDHGCRVEVVRERLAPELENATFGAFAPELAGLIGAVGLFREDKLKSNHRVHVWGMYVAPSARGSGLGRRLLEAVVDHARHLEGVTHVQLSVSETAPEARRLYESLGFEAWGTEPEAMRVGEKLLAEIHLSLRL